MKKFSKVSIPFIPEKFQLSAFRSFLNILKSQYFIRFWKILKSQHSIHFMQSISKFPESWEIHPGGHSVNTICLEAEILKSPQSTELAM